MREIRQRVMKKTITAVASIIFMTVFSVPTIVALGSTTAAAQGVMSIAAIVNEDVISVFDLESRISLSILSSGLQNRKEIRQKLAPQVLRALIDEKLQLQDAKGKEIEIGEKAVEDALKEIGERNQVPGGNILAYLEQQGIDGNTMTDQVKSNLAWFRIIHLETRRSGKISDEEIDEEMRRIEANKGKPERLVSEIFLAVESKEREREVRTLAERLAQQIRQGANFGRAAEQFSQSATAAIGGDLGWVIQGQLIPELEKQLGQMQPGELSEPIRSISGYHLLKLHESRISGTVSANETEVRLQQVVIEVPKDASKAIYSAKMAVAQRVSQSARSCQSMADIGKDIGSPLSGDLGTVKIGMLPANLRNQVSRLDLGRASQPIPSENGILVLMICDKKTPQEENEITKRQKIKDRLLGIRREMVARRLIRNLRRSAFIDIRI